MDAETEQALRKSIAKWEKNTRVRNLDNALVSAEDCPLCLIHNPDIVLEAAEYCEDCPVAKASGYSFCEGTPYVGAYRYWELDEHTAFRAAAKKEVAFLKSLLPENNQ